MDSRHIELKRFAEGEFAQGAVNRSLESGDQLKPSSYTDEGKLYLSRV